MPFDPPLDSGITDAVLALQRYGVETFESCEGGKGHAYPDPTVRFHGHRFEGFRALAAAMKERLPVAELRRVWPIQDEEPTGPWWEMTFAKARTSCPDNPLPPSPDSPAVRLVAREGWEVLAKYSICFSALLKIAARMTSEPTAGTVALGAIQDSNRVGV